MGWLVNALAALTPEEPTWYPQKRRVFGVQNQNGLFEEERNLLLLSGMEPDFLRREARSPINIPNTLSLFVHIARAWN
jgi:hypothetical protein